MLHVIAEIPVGIVIMVNFWLVNEIFPLIITNPPGPICHSVPAVNAKTQWFLIFISITVPVKVVFHK